MLAIAMSLTTACAKKMAAPPPPPPPPSIVGDAGAPESLFKGDQAVLSDQDIARILGTQLKLAGRHRLAILSLSSSYWWSEDLADAETRNFDKLLRALKNSPQLSERSTFAISPGARKTYSALLKRSSRSNPGRSSIRLYRPYPDLSTGSFPEDRSGSCAKRGRISSAGCAHRDCCSHGPCQRKYCNAEVARRSEL